MSSLESLLFGSTVDNEQSELEAAEELALWSNAEFTFDIKPGSSSSCNDESKAQQPQQPQQQQSRSLDDVLDVATYEKLVNYLDYELPLQQQQQQQPDSSSSITPATTQERPVYQAPIAAAPSPAAATASASAATSRKPLLLPKPAPLDPLQFATLMHPLPHHMPVSSHHLPIAPAAATVTPSTPSVRANKRSNTATTAGTKRPAAAAAESDRNDEQVAAEEDKRRRNTAASARFRIKKKMREQAMEQTVREMTAKSDKLQERVVELEQEVKWLRGLLLEK